MRRRGSAEAAAITARPRDHVRRARGASRRASRVDVRASVARAATPSAAAAASNRAALGDAPSATRAFARVDHDVAYPDVGSGRVDVDERCRGTRVLSATEHRGRRSMSRTARTRSAARRRCYKSELERPDRPVSRSSRAPPRTRGPRSTRAGAGRDGRGHEQIEAARHAGLYVRGRRRRACKYDHPRAARESAGAGAFGESPNATEVHAIASSDSAPRRRTSRGRCERREKPSL